MTQDKSSTYEDFRETASEYGEDKGHDLLTDPAAIDSARDSAEETGESHGRRMKSLRESKGFTIEELSERAGIDIESLKLLESGEMLLPLGQLIKLSKALSLRMADVISEGEEEFTVVRADERRTFSRFGKSKQADKGYEYESLAPNKKDRLMEPFIVTLKPSEDEELSSHDGQEFIFVLEGEMEAVVDQKRTILKPGDSIYYDSTSMHLVKAHGDKAAKILAVLIS